MHLRRLFLLLILLQQLLFAQTITHGPMIGGVTENAARIYIRTDVPVNFTLEYSTDSLFSSFDQINSATDSAWDNTKIVSLDNLTPLTDYYFRYRINGNIDATQGQFKTFPVEGTSGHLVFVTGSCQETPNMKVFNVMPLYHPNLFIHTGDFTYPSYQIGASYPGDWSTIELAWRKRNEEPICRDMLRKLPIAYMPDDDDTWGNSKYNKGGASQIRYEHGKLINYYDLIPRTQQMRDNCFKGYKNFFPGYPVVNDTDGYYHSFKVGNCEFFVIDVRSCNTGGWNNLKYNAQFNLWTFDGNNPAQTLLNHPQLEWLLSGLKNSTSTWKFIISGVPFNKNIQQLVELPLLLQGTQFTIAGYAGTGFKMSYSFSDYFGAYAYERTKILNFIKNNAIKNVIVISGDTHGFGIDDGKNAGLPEMNASGLSVSSTELYYQFDHALSAFGFDLKKWLWNQGGMGIGNNNTKNAFGKMEVFGNDSVQLCIIDEDNTTIACYSVKNNELVTGVHDLKVLNDLVNIFPNPASDKIYIQLNNKYSGEKIQRVKVIEITGREVYNKVFDTPFTAFEIPVKDFASGAYFLSMETEHSFAVQKFVKE
ncbi:MAG: C-terminal target protein [Bacteroidota bacterium]|nr:C-terminal target protein [Bacteroidota bacterium]